MARSGKDKRTGLETGGAPPDPVLAGSRALIIGPARTANDDIAPLDLDGFDWIIRLNNAVNAPLEYRGVPYPRFNLHFRNQAGNAPDSPAGRIDRAAVKRCGIERIIFAAGKRRKRLRRLRVQLGLRLSGVRAGFAAIGPAYIEALAAPLAPRRPSLGFVALNYLMDCGLAELHVAGFTFFTTRYLSGYNEKVFRDEDALQWATGHGGHDPVAERRLFRVLYETRLAAGSNIVLAESVRRAVYAPRSAEGGAPP